jgi:hypothetical protein
VFRLPVPGAETGHPGALATAASAVGISDSGSAPGRREAGASVVDMIMNGIVVLIVVGLFLGIIMLWRSTQ